MAIEMNSLSNQSCAMVIFFCYFRMFRPISVLGLAVVAIAVLLFSFPSVVVCSSSDIISREWNDFWDPRINEVENTLETTFPKEIIGIITEYYHTAEFITHGVKEKYIGRIKYFQHIFGCEVHPSPYLKNEITQKQNVVSKVNASRAIRRLDDDELYNLLHQDAPKPKAKDIFRKITPTAIENEAIVFYNILEFYKYITLPEHFIEPACYLITGSEIPSFMLFHVKIEMQTFDFINKASLGKSSSTVCMYMHIFPFSFFRFCILLFFQLGSASV